MKFFISVEETRSTTVVVEADTFENALLAVEDAYCRDEVCLDNPDCIHDGTEFYDVTDRYSPDYAHKFQEVKPDAH